MEPTLLWLIPTGLAVMAVLLLLWREPRKKSVLFVEPLGTIIKKWQFARHEGITGEIEAALSQLAQLPIVDVLLEPLVASLKSKHFHLGKVELVDLKMLGSYSWQAVLKQDRKTFSYVFGLRDEIEPYLDKASCLEVTSALSDENTAGRHGFLQLALGVCQLHGASPQKTTNLRHRLLGVVLFEPVIDEGFIEKLMHSGKGRIKFLTVSPLSFAEAIFTRHGIAKINLAVSGKNLEKMHPPKFAEADLLKADVIAEASLKLKHWAVRLHLTDHNCLMISANPEDQDLPLGQSRLF